MNFLAHCALAHDAAGMWGATAEQTDGLLAGAVLGDFCKGAVPTAWPAPLQAGVRVHRRIDALADRDPTLSRICARYPAPLRRFAPIFADLLVDHSLARNWADFYSHSHPEFAQACYRAILARRDYLPDRGRRFVDYLVEADLLTHYDQSHHLVRGVESVLRRLGRDELHGPAVAATLGAVPEVDTALPDFYPRLRAHWREWGSVRGFLESFDGG